MNIFYSLLVLLVMPTVLPRAWFRLSMIIVEVHFIMPLRDD
jgi:hypothetical protein